ncbi:hypothetical protein AB0R11_18910, partial [Streptomyces fradiae]|uniref:hypothetical protein n=1 Tax=Streptomyces fradiae TaxID=1906 RepID=UPI00343D05DE
MGRSGLTRRRALVTAATAAGVPGVLAGCTGPGTGGGGAARPSAAEAARRAELALLRRSAAVSGVLLAGYDEALAAHPAALGTRLAPLREAAARHVAALTPPGERAPATASTGARTGSPDPGAGSRAPGTGSPDGRTAGPDAGARPPGAGTASRRRSAARRPGCARCRAGPPRRPPG